jgi:hypothetical protein
MQIPARRIETTAILPAEGRRSSTHSPGTLSSSRSHSNCPHSPRTSLSPTQNVVPQRSYQYSQSEQQPFFPRASDVTLARQWQYQRSRWEPQPFFPPRQQCQSAPPERRPALRTTHSTRPIRSDGARARYFYGLASPDRYSLDSIIHSPTCHPSSSLRAATSNHRYNLPPSCQTVWRTPIRPERRSRPPLSAETVVSACSVSVRTPASSKN